MNKSADSIAAFVRDGDSTNIPAGDTLERIEIVVLSHRLQHGDNVSLLVHQINHKNVIVRGRESAGILGVAVHK